ncbi:hypothetical protein BaRGS_00031900 [Batillaria attramentaria]|uniref:Uncharacterized protein n=1 Tax=Batillaria attramentaria TaxID=370345 RepID=A0ABD0JQ52_9CAEN
MANLLSMLPVNTDDQRSWIGCWRLGRLLLQKTKTTGRHFTAPACLVWFQLFACYSLTNDKSTALHVVCGNTDLNSEYSQVVLNDSANIKTKQKGTTKGKGKKTKPEKPTEAESAAESQSSIAWKLLMGGADVGAKDCKGRTPLHLACLYGKEAIVSMMFGNTLRPDVAMSMWNVINLRDEDKRTPLHMAYLEGNEGIVKMLNE